jgi:hypothetical protein
MIGPMISKIHKMKEDLRESEDMAQMTSVKLEDTEITLQMHKRDKSIIDNMYKALREQKSQNMISKNINHYTFLLSSYYKSFKAVKVSFPKIAEFSHLEHFLACLSKN